MFKKMIVPGILMVGLLTTVLPQTGAAPVLIGVSKARVTALTEDNQVIAFVAGMLIGFFNIVI